MKVSVCMATYNGSKFIEPQIKSIIDQLAEGDELIISDDHSQDTTIALIKHFRDPRIKIYKNKQKHNLISNFENALSHATGDIVLLADQDDIWLDNKVKTFKQVLANYDLVMSDCIVVDEELNIIHSSRFEKDNCKKGLLTNIIKNNYMGCCMGFSRQVLTKALPFPKDIPMHDMWIGIMGELFFKVNFIKEPLIYYRRHTLNASFTSTKSSYSFLKKLEFRYLLLKNLIRYGWAGPK